MKAAACDFDTLAGPIISQRGASLQAGGTDPLPGQVPATIMKTLTNLLRRGHELLVAGGAVLQSPFLLALRLYFFWQLFLTGKGKLERVGFRADRLSFSPVELWNNRYRIGLILLLRGSRNFFYLCAFKLS